MPKISKTAQVLKFFAQQYGPPGIPRKRLVKLAYMADVIARQCLGRPITELRYIKDHFGPNARELKDFVTELVTAEAAEQTMEHDGEYRTIRLRSSRQPVLLTFTLGEAEILGYVATNYSSMDIEEFIETVVKETDPFQAAERLGEVLRMEVVDGTVRDAIGFDLEKAANAQRQIEQGNYVTLAQIANELRSQATA